MAWVLIIAGHRYSNLYQDLSFLAQIQSLITRMSHTNFICPYCIEDDFTAPSEVLLLTHIRRVHSFEPNFSIQCSIDGCSRTFKNFRTYQNHRLTHRPAISEGDIPSDTESNPDYDQDPSFEGSMLPHLPSSSDVQSHAAKWILKTSEMRSLTRAATIGVVEDVSDLVEFIGQSLKDQTCHILSSSGVDPETVCRVSDVFKSYIVKPFDGLSSFHQQLQYYRRHFNLIVRSYCMFLVFIIIILWYVGITA